MSKISRQVKEIIQIVVFLIIVGALLYFYAIYPLGQTKTLFARPDIDDFDNDSIVTNDATIWEEAGLPVDTFRVESDGLTNLACLYVPVVDSIIEPKGTIFLLHYQRDDRDTLLPLARQLNELGYAIVPYDQRASARSTGRYHGEGGYESTDLIEVMRYLDLRGQIIHPLTVVGYSVGGDAALLAALEEKRIDRVVAIDPHLSTDRMMDRVIDRNDLFWFPLRSTMLWWWYNIRSSYASPYRELDNVKAVACRTLLIVPDDAMDDAEVVRLKELSPAESLEIITGDLSYEATASIIEGFVTGE
jgi:dipeptidyl aminopeptidase/acylaminoacyl peptidase